MNDVWVVKAGEDEYEVIAHLFAGTYDYRELEHKPQINDVELNGNKTLQDLNIASINQLESESSRAQNAEQTLASAIGAEAQRAQGAEQTLRDAINTESERAQQVEQGLQGTIQSESQRAQQAEGELSRDLAAETQRATAKEAELEAEIAQQGKVDDVKVDDISVVEGKIAKIYTRIKGFGIGTKLILELSHFLSYSGNKISITNPYAYTTNHKILI